MGGDDDSGSDRAAILARRQRFIALALSGLAVGCGDDGNTTGPQPCLDAPPPTESNSSAGTSSPTSTDATESMSGPAETGSTETSGTPMPCLDVAPDSSSGTTDGSTTGAATSSDTSAGSGSDTSGKLP